jgi:hypothetical protein
VNVEQRLDPILAPALFDPAVEERLLVAVAVVVRVDDGVTPPLELRQHRRLAHARHPGDQHDRHFSTVISGGGSIGDPARVS